MLRKLSLFIFFLLFISNMALANNVTVTNVALQNLNSTNGTIEVKFDLNWENYYSGTDGNSQPYFDAAWVFVKIYRSDTGVWDHAKLISGGTVGDYSATTKLGITSDGVGAFCSPGSNQTLIWNYASVPVSMTIASPCVVTYNSHNLAANAEVVFSTNGALPTGITAGTTYYVKSPAANTFNISATPGGAAINTSGSQSGQHRMQASSLMFPSAVQARVFAIEMAYIPQGSFSLGSGGSEISAFYLYPTTTNTYTVSSENAITVGTTNGNLYYPNGSGSPGDRAGPLPAAFPKGYNGFYIMKYEISQGQYADFLNTLTSTQASNRYPNISSYRHTISGSYQNYAASRPHRACNWISWADVAAYADWAGLRPFTELEFEKVCRGGGIAAVANEYVWGTIDAPVAATTISGTENGTETITNAGANCAFNNTTFTGGDGGTGPLRCGIFATSSSTRVTSGAAYYGVMDLAGSLWERVVSVGSSAGRAFTGLNGDGFLDSSGNANVSNWPGTNASGTGIRGGTWDFGATGARTSDRNYASGNDSPRYQYYGGRAVRTAQ